MFRMHSRCTQSNAIIDSCVCIYRECSHHFHGIRLTNSKYDLLRVSILFQFNSHIGAWRIIGKVEIEWKIDLWRNFIRDLLPLVHAEIWTLDKDTWIPNAQAHQQFLIWRFLLIELAKNRNFHFRSEYMKNRSIRSGSWVQKVRRRPWMGLNGNVCMGSLCLLLCDLIIV